MSIKIEITGLPDNPHEYDDDAFTEASVSFMAAVVDGAARMWLAGADADDIASDLMNALDEATG